MTDDLLVTPNHPVYSGGRWLAIGTLPTPSDVHALDDAAGRAAPRRLHAFQPTGRIGPVCNLEVDVVHSYFARGVLVHNGRALMK